MLEFDLRKRFLGRVLSFDEAVADRWGVLTGELKRKGRPMPTVDGMIATTALHQPTRTP
jgi:predicted nucleic acid-binding protein